MRNVRCRGVRASLAGVVATNVCLLKGLVDISIIFALTKLTVMRIKLMTLCMALCCLCLNAFAQNVPDYVPTEGLVAWYPFNGNANDESGNGNDGTVVGASATIDRDGNLNSALEFLGAPVPGTDRTEVAVDNHVAVPNFGEGFENGISISLWSEVYPTSESAFLQRRNNNNIDFSLELNNSQQPGVHLGFMALGSTSSIVNEWTHIALSYDEQTVQLFKNGMLIASEPSTQNINSYDDLLLIGKYIYYGGNTHHFFFNGKQDDIGIWNRALTEEEILALYNAELPIPGCTDSNACNFNPEATGDDGSCIPPGCMEAEACNYNIEALCDDGICIYPPVVDLGGAVTLCEGQTVVLGVDASEFDVLWSNGSDSSSIEIGQTGTYWVQVGSANETDYRLEFDGVDDYVSFGNSLNITEYPFSIQLDATVSEGGFNIHTDDGTDGYSGVWMELNSTNMSVSVGSGWGGGPGQRRSKIASHGKQPGELVTVTAVVSGATDMSLYLDGVDVGGTYSGYGNTTFVDNGLDAVIGRFTASSGSLVNQLIYHTGSADNLHVWTKALTAEEAATFATTSATGSEEDLLALYTFDEGSGAVTVDDAQGFEATLFGNPTWVLDNIGCVASDTVAVYFIDCQNVCGPGTYWDETELSCLPLQTCQEDLDGDGVIGVNDLMQLLSLFGTDCEAEDVDPELGEFTCGDPMNYHGYDYATVQIGEQCWFAENLRNEHYANGDAIPGELSNSEWQLLTTLTLALKPFTTTTCPTLLITAACTIGTQWMTGVVCVPAFGTFRLMGSL